MSIEGAAAAGTLAILRAIWKDSRRWRRDGLAQIAFQGGRGIRAAKRGIAKKLRKPG
jgi:hypothetical protein